MPLKEIAASLHIKMPELLDELEAIVYSGTRLDLRYDVEETMDEEQFDDIYGYFEEAETDSLDDAYDEFDGDYSDEDIRLVRLMYVSENAN
jgi:ATP-dependent DNA helicase RecQ